MHHREINIVPICVKLKGIYDDVSYGKLRSSALLTAARRLLTPSLL
jgi:hypothetical protein